MEKRPLSSLGAMSTISLVPICVHSDRQMPPRRHVSQPSISCSSRSSLDSSNYPSIDAVLKQLKTCSRRLQTALACHRNELQVLERLYYKGKNQHRTALFWQRVAEIRRYGDRVECMAMQEVVESLRLSFWGDASVRTSKILKGSWTHYPDAKPMTFVLERCANAFSKHISEYKRHEASAEVDLALRTFSLAIQNGAFAQLILTLIAITSRMDMLLTEVRATLDITWSACYGALQTLHASSDSPSMSCRDDYISPILYGQPSQVRLVKPLTEREFEDISSPNSTFVEPIKQVPSAEGIIDEDLGSSLDRPKIAEGMTRVSLLPTEESSTFGANVSSQSEAALVFEPTKIISSLPAAVKIPESLPVSRESTVTITKRRKTEGDSTGPKQPLKKKKKKKDEIDDIFGF
ncbi:hypothetical protein A0H81_04390 [Grifola frondosa]|uniref:Nucleolus and neural progenitor protein-like N-terminal domain-containing protein n=1 Tax=Grifola frondosa TaxID=5627 RepID=A0A1C7MEL3_GRIFR|nr:hypothetical protein A0H81_04390 [Grifola frondosa]